MPSILLITAPVGAQPRLRSKALEELKGKGYELERRSDSAEWAELFEEAITPSLFSPQRIFEVDDAKSLGALPERFVRFVEPKGADSIFLLISDKDLKKELGSAFKLAESVPYEAAPYWPSQRAGWLQKVAREMGYALDSRAAALLVDWVEDEEELRAEVDKLGRAAPNGRINAALAEALSVDEGGREVLDLLDAASKADVATAVKSLSKLREGGELIPTIAALHKRVRGACLAASLGDDAAKALRLTAFQTKTAKAMASRYGKRLLSVWLGELIRLSMLERTGDGEGWEGLEALLLSVFSRSGRNP